MVIQIGQPIEAAALEQALLRRAEVVALNREDFHEQTGELVVRGKGRKERLVYVDNGALDALLDWLVVRGDAPGPLFVPINKGGELQWGWLSGQAVQPAVQADRQKGVPRRLLASDHTDVSRLVPGCHRFRGRG